jgi:arginyl-tRNA synthetase
MIHQELAAWLQQVAQQEFGQEVTPAEVEISYPDADRGELATNLAFKLSKQLKTAPQEIAQRISISSMPNFIAKTTADKGYLNFVLKPAVWESELASIEKNYGASRHGAGKKLQVEFVSANPTGPLTLANARGGFWGDVLANVLTTQGFEVTREYYLNDAGNQMAELAQAVADLRAGRQPKSYQGDYLSDLAGSKPRELADEVMKKLIQPALSRMGIKYDVWFSESSELIDAHKPEEALQKLRDLGAVEEKDGALWLKADTPRVLVKSNGEYTYLLVDLAYHLNKLVERKFDAVINIWGADHHGQVIALREGLQALGLAEQVDVVLMQMVRLINNGVEVKVSKRAGTFVTVDELVEQVGSDVARFFFLMRSPDSHMDFDLNLAKEHSQKNPLYYLMYAYVRSGSILRQAQSKQLKPAGATGTLSAQERQIVIKMSQWPGLLQTVALDYGVQRLAFFGVELARLFHDYYETTHIIDLSSEEAEQKLYLIQQFRQFMLNYFGILGITPIEKM